MKSNYLVKQCVIPAGQALTSVINIEDYNYVTIVMPDVWTAANLTLQVSPSVDGPFKNAYDDSGTEVSITAAAARTLNASTKIGSYKYIKLRSGTAGVPVNQVAERTIVLILKKN